MSRHTLAASIQRLHVENINTLHLSQDFQSVQTSGLLEVRRDSADFRSLGEEVVFSLDFCRRGNMSVTSLPRFTHSRSLVYEHLVVLSQLSRKTVWGGVERTNLRTTWLGQSWMVLVPRIL